MQLNENEIPYKSEIESYLNFSKDKKEDFLIRLARAASKESQDEFYGRPSGDKYIKMYEVFSKFLRRTKKERADGDRHVQL